MKSSELLRKLSKAGCYMVRQGKGSHEIWFSPITEKNSLSPITVREIGKGLELKIKKWQEFESKNVINKLKYLKNEKL